MTMTIMRPATLLAVILFAVPLSGVALAALNAQEGRSGLPITEVEGRISAIVPATAERAQGLILEIPSGATRTLYLQDCSEFRMKLGDLPCTLADLTPGMQVTVTYNPRTMQIIILDHDVETELKLIIGQVDLPGKTITGRTADGRSITINATDKTRVEARGNLSSIGGLQPGASISVRFNPVTHEASRIIELSSEGHEAGNATLKMARGTVKFFNESRRLTLVLPDNSELTLFLGTSTKIIADGGERVQRRVASISDLTVGDTVEVEYTADGVAKVIQILKGRLPKTAQTPVPTA